MIGIEARVITAPKGIFSGTPTGNALDFTGSLMRHVKPAFSSMVDAMREGTENKNIADGWHENPPQGAGGTVMFSATNEHPASAVYYTGSVPHDIPQPQHWVPYGKLLRFYSGMTHTGQGTFGFGGDRPASPAAAARGFQVWGSRNEWIIKHPGTQPHAGFTDVIDREMPRVQEAAQQAFAEAVSARFA